MNSHAYTERMATVASTLFRLDRGYVAVEGPEAADFLERMLSNEVASLEAGEARQALLLTPKGRIVAPLRAVRESADRFLLITEAELADVLAAALSRARFAAKCEIDVKPYHGYLQLGSGHGIQNDDYGVEGFESWGQEEHEAPDAAKLEQMRIEACTPVWARSSTTRFFRPRPGSTRRTSRSPRAATRARSRWLASTTAATRTAASACSSWGTRSRETSWSTRTRSSAASRAQFPAAPSPMSAARCPKTRGYT